MLTMSFHSAPADSESNNLIREEKPAGDRDSLELHTSFRQAITHRSPLVKPFLGNLQSYRAESFGFLS